VDHADSLVSSDLMEVRVSDIVLLSICWESSVGVWAIVVLVDLSNMPFPLSDHALFLLLFIFLSSQAAMASLGLSHFRLISALRRRELCVLTQSVET
jgi:hypothetical protein